MSIVRVLSIFVFVRGEHGLETAAIIQLIYQFTSWILIIPSALRYVRWQKSMLMGAKDLRELIRYSLHIQVSNITAIVNVQADAIIIALFLPIRDVALYTTGANLAVQVRGLLSNLLNPLGVRFATIFGDKGTERTFEEFCRMQDGWVKLNTGLFFIAIGSSLFVVENWLGPSFLQAGLVCIILLVGYMINMFTGPLTLYLNAVGLSSIEARYGLVAMLINIFFTIPLLLLGLLGVVGATAAGTIVGSMYLLLIARRSARSDIPSFLAQAPWFHGLVASAMAAVSCEGLRILISLHGAAGLLFCTIGTAPALLYFYYAVLRNRETLTFLRSG